MNPPLTSQPFLPAPSWEPQKSPHGSRAAGWTWLPPGQQQQPWWWSARQPFVTDQNIKREDSREQDLCWNPATALLGNQAKAVWELPGDDVPREPKMSLLSLRVTACPAVFHRVSSTAKGERAGDGVRQVQMWGHPAARGTIRPEKGDGNEKITDDPVWTPIPG